MTYEEMKMIVDSYEARKLKAEKDCTLEPVGIDIVYVNSLGEEKSLTIRNVCPSEHYGHQYIDADCFSYYRANDIGVINGRELDAAITSRRTFKLSRIRSATVCNEEVE